jgi:hypothetical protein
MTTTLAGDVRTYRLIAPNVADTAKLARDHVAGLMALTGHPQLIDTARLLASEVVTNVHLHTRVPRLTVDTTVRTDRALIAVYDASPGRRPVLRTALPSDAESGRGLALIELLAATWGTTWHGAPDPVGKTVWFELRDEDPDSQLGPQWK